MSKCKWHQQRPAIHQFLDKTFEWIKPSYTKTVRPTEAHILKSVEDEALFGLVDCVIHVPDDLAENVKKCHRSYKILR